jgi:hypothetical protein
MENFHVNRGSILNVTPGPGWVQVRVKFAIWRAEKNFIPRSQSYDRELQRQRCKNLQRC